jgi:hypothetical protein
MALGKPADFRMPVCLLKEAAARSLLSSVFCLLSSVAQRKPLASGETVSKLGSLTHVRAVFPPVVTHLLGSVVADGNRGIVLMPGAVGLSGGPATIYQDGLAGN